MTVIVLQAGAARRVWGRDPAAARIAVDALTGVARETLAELRVTLRDDVVAPDDARPSSSARLRPLGVAVTVHRDGPPLPAAVERRRVRVVREALTNADAARRADHRPRRHRGDRRATSASTVTDAGRSGAPPHAGVAGTGTGLRGLAERVAGCGGELRCGPHGAGFRVEARLPVAQAVPRDRPRPDRRRPGPRPRRACGCSSTPSPTSRSSARRSTASRRSTRHGGCGPTSC